MSLLNHAGGVVTRLTWVIGLRELRGSNFYMGYVGYVGEKCFYASHNFYVGCVGQKHLCLVQIFLRGPNFLCVGPKFFVWFNFFSLVCQLLLRV